MLPASSKYDATGSTDDADSGAIPKRPYKCRGPGGGRASVGDAYTFARQTSAASRSHRCTAGTTECMHLAAPNWNDDDDDEDAEQN